MSVDVCTTASACIKIKALCRVFFGFKNIVITVFGIRKSPTLRIVVFVGFPKAYIAQISCRVGAIAPNIERTTAIGFVLKEIGFSYGQTTACNCCIIHVIFLSDLFRS